MRWGDNLQNLPDQSLSDSTKLNLSNLSLEVLFLQRKQTFLCFDSVDCGVYCDPESSLPACTRVILLTGHNLFKLSLAADLFVGKLDTDWIIFSGAAVLSRASNIFHL